MLVFRAQDVDSGDAVPVWCAFWAREVDPGGGWYCALSD